LHRFGNNLSGGNQLPAEVAADVAVIREDVAGLLSFAGALTVTVRVDVTVRPL
jgi:hypothetical protein